MNKKMLALAIAGLSLQSVALAAAQKLHAPTPNPQSAQRGSGIVADPSFEDGTPNSFWTEASTNFGTPLCSEVACGTGTSTAPVRTGTFWAWFGGTDSVETGSVTQSVTLPADSTVTLDFGFQAPICVASANHFVEVQIDGTPVWHADGNHPLCNIITGYDDISVDLSAYAGQTVSLAFYSETDGGGTSNFFIDDAQITAVAAAVLTPDQPIPANANWNIAGIALALGLVGLLALRRQS